MISSHGHFFSPTNHCWGALFIFLTSLVFYIHLNYLFYETISQLVGKPKMSAPFLKKRI